MTLSQTNPDARPRPDPFRWSRSRATQTCHDFHDPQRPLTSQRQVDAAEQVEALRRQQTQEVQQAQQQGGPWPRFRWRPPLVAMLARAGSGGREGLSDAAGAGAGCRACVRRCLSSLRCDQRSSRARPRGKAAADGVVGHAAGAGDSGRVGRTQSGGGPPGPRLAGCVRKGQSTRFTAGSFQAPSRSVFRGT